MKLDLIQKAVDEAVLISKEIPFECDISLSFNENGGFVLFITCDGLQLEANKWENTGIKYIFLGSENEPNDSHVNEFIMAVKKKQAITEIEAKMATIEDVEILNTFTDKLHSVE